jgi:chemotaxis regulatin CheY-phosphate phosphatase CheZ
MTDDEIEKVAREIEAARDESHELSAEVKAILHRWEVDLATLIEEVEVKEWLKQKRDEATKRPR